MAEPCKQEAPIASIQATLKALEKGLSSIHASMEKTASALSVLVQQTVEIRTLRETDQRHETDIDNLYTRVRALELAPGRTLGKGFWLLSAAASSTAGGVVTGVILWLVKG